MSVALFRDSEFRGIAVALGGAPPIKSALCRMAAANREAYAASYPDEAALAKAPLNGLIEWEGEAEAIPPWADTAREWVKNLLYNCVAQNGRDFAPSWARDVLLAACSGQENGG